MEIILSRSQGFCAGVTYAVAIVENTLKRYGPPLYVYHEIVHNTFVVNDFRDQGVVFVDDLEAVPVGARVIFSAHGVPPSVIAQAKTRQLQFIDATCPLVKKVHKEAERFSQDRCHVVLIGHAKHQEIIGTAGYIAPELLHIIEKEKDIDSLAIPPTTSVAYLTQTTLSVDETRAMVERLKQKFPQLIGPVREDICYATQRRQDAVKDLARVADLIIVCGSPNSSNSNRLKETAQKAGVATVIIDNASELDLNILEGKNKIGISSGASVPRGIVDDVVKKIQQRYSDVVVQNSPDPSERTGFPLPEV